MLLLVFLVAPIILLVAKLLGIIDFSYALVFAGWWWGVPLSFFVNMIETGDKPSSQHEGKVKDNKEFQVMLTMSAIVMAILTFILFKVF